MAYLGIPQNTIAVLQKYHFNFQKKFGQNFLIDTTVLDRIISSAEITKEDCVLEIGPGIGTMTQYLAERAASGMAEVSAPGSKPSRASASCKLNKSIGNTLPG